MLSAGGSCSLLLVLVGILQQRMTLHQGLVHRRKQHHDRTLAWDVLLMCAQSLYLVHAWLNPLHTKQRTGGMLIDPGHVDLGVVLVGAGVSISIWYTRIRLDRLRSNNALSDAEDT